MVPAEDWHAEVGLMAAAGVRMEDNPDESVERTLTVVVTGTLNGYTCDGAEGSHYFSRR